MNSMSMSRRLAWPPVFGKRRTDAWGLCRRLRALLRRLDERARQRRALSRLDARLLRDIGVSPEAARAESRKPFWRA